MAHGSGDVEHSAFECGKSWTGKTESVRFGDGMIRKRHTTAQWVAQTLALALAAAILFAVLTPLIAVPVAVLLEQARGESDGSLSRAGLTYFFGFFWMGVWMAMALVPAAGFAVAGWMPFWVAGSKRSGLRKWWVALIWGALAGLVAVMVFLLLEGFASLPGGNGKWSVAAVSGGLIGGSIVGAGLFLLTVKLMPKIREERLIAAPPPVISVAPAPVKIGKIEVPKPVVKKPKKEKRDENLKWTDWGKTWKPPGDEEEK